MTYSDKVESYLINLGITYENIDENMWLISDEEKGLSNVVLILEDPILIARVNVMEIPKSNKEEFYEKVLTLNGSDLVHGAYAMEEKDLILIDTMEIATLDIEEIQASLDAIGLALAQHYSVLSKYRD